MVNSLPSSYFRHKWEIRETESKRDPRIKNMRPTKPLTLKKKKNRNSRSTLTDLMVWKVGEHRGRRTESRYVSDVCLTVFETPVSTTLQSKWLYMKGRQTTKLLLTLSRRKQRDIIEVCPPKTWNRSIGFILNHPPNKNIVDKTESSFLRGDEKWTNFRQVEVSVVRVNRSFVNRVKHSNVIRNLILEWVLFLTRRKHVVF